MSVHAPLAHAAVDPPARGPRGGRRTCALQLLGAAGSDAARRKHMETASVSNAPAQRSPGAAGPASAAQGSLGSRTVVVPVDPPAVGALVDGCDVHWQPFDRPPTHAWAVAALAVVGATAVGWRWAGRPGTVRTITMGPGGWVSFKGVKPPPLTAAKPWWAHVLRAERLHT